MIEQGADERRIRSLLRRRGVGPDAPAPVHPAAAPGHTPDWWDRLYDADNDRAAPTEDAGERHASWWSVRKHHGEPATASPPVVQPVEPGIQVIINQAPAVPGVSPRRARIRRWVLHRGTAAAAGWGLGLGPAVAGALTNAGPGALGVALLLYLVAWLAATRLLRLVPSAATHEVHIAADWAAHIPDATVLLALALNTPGALS